MPSPTRQRGYPVSTSLMAILVAIGAATFVLRSAIPPPEPNSLQTEAGDYFKSGSIQPVEWRVLSSEVFAEARRQDKLVLLAVGSPASRAARTADLSAFSDREVAEELRQGFICVRIDQFQTPGWANVFLPVSRSQLDLDVGIQIWILDPQGRLFAWLLRQSPLDRPDGYTLLRVIRQAKKDFGDRGTGTETKASQAQLRDTSALTGAISGATPPFGAHASQLSASIDKSFGGFPSSQNLALPNPYLQRFQRPTPLSWMYLMECGLTDALQTSISPALASPIVDWLDGGFFRLADRIDWTDVEADKLAIQNSQMASLMSNLWAQTRDPYYLRLAQNTFDALTDDFIHDGLVACYRSINEGFYGRNSRSSMVPRLLREKFSAEEREWMRTNLGLRVEVNPQMIPFMANRRAFYDDSEKVDSILKRMSGATSTTDITYGTSDLMDVNGYVCARLIESARIMGDMSRLQKARALFGRLQEFRGGPDDVLHSMRQGVARQTYLGDYLAFADACLQEYLTSGDQFALENGRNVLKRGIFLFGGKEPGLVFNARLAQPPPWPIDVDSPQIIDGERESTSAMLIRLTQHYGAILSDASLRNEAVAAARRYGDVARIIGRGASGFFSAAKQVCENTLAVAVGPHAKDMAASVAKIATRAICIVPTKRVHPELEKLKPGVYVLHDGRVEGPWTVDQAGVNLNHSLCIPTKGLP